VGYAAATVIWVIAGDRLPGGRWLAVHLFTLGALTNAVAAFSIHFGQAVARAPRQAWRWQPLILNVGVVLVLVGIPTRDLPATASGPAITTAIVFDSYLPLRRMRHVAVGARFAWVAARCVHPRRRVGAAAGHRCAGRRMVRPRADRTPARQRARLGRELTLLATLVFFGPTMLRTRIVDGADDAAAPALRLGATALTVAVLLLLTTGVGGVAATALRIAAAAGLGVCA
jgi:hypothetical protein